MAGVIAAVTILASRAAYTVRLHFVDPSFGAAGARAFSVTVNGERDLAALDIAATAGDKNRAIVEDIKANADAAGSIKIGFHGHLRIPGYDPNGPLLSEDYVSSLAEAADGGIWVGHRLTGVEKIDAGTLAAIPTLAGSGASDYATALASLKNGAVVAGWYSAGLSDLAAPGSSAGEPDKAADSGAPPCFPTPAAPPAYTELTTMLRAAAGGSPGAAPAEPNDVVALDDDWTTEGDWLGRYGRYWACLCATVSPYNYVWGAGWDKVRYCLRIGPAANTGDSLRYWVHWLYSSNPRVLELPPTYLDSRIKRGLTAGDRIRRQAEADDHGEAYPWCVDGPNLYCTVTVPAGLFYLSLYDFNKDGHEALNRDRDYTISIRQHPAGAALSDIGGFAGEQDLAHGRIVDFWGGVWKRFLVRGPIDLTIELKRNNSLNTVLPTIMLDLVDEEPPPYFSTVDQWRQRPRVHDWPDAALLLAKGPNDPSTAGLVFAPSEAEAANRLFALLGSIRDSANPLWWAVNKQRYYVPLIRWYAQQNGGLLPTSATSARLAEKLGSCCYEAGLFGEWEALRVGLGLRTARNIEKALRSDGVHGDGDGYTVVSSYVAKTK